MISTDVLQVGFLSPPLFVYETTTFLKTVVFENDRSFETIYIKKTILF